MRRRTFAVACKSLLAVAVEHAAVEVVVVVAVVVVAVVVVAAVVAVVVVAVVVVAAVAAVVVVAVVSTDRGPGRRVPSPLCPQNRNTFLGPVLIEENNNAKS